MRDINWHDNDGNGNRDRFRPVDEDMYRGAYRFDNTGRDAHETTYNGFDRNRPYSREDYDRPHNNTFAQRSPEQDSGAFRGQEAIPRKPHRYDDRPHPRYHYNESSGWGNFDGHYGPDHYGRGHGENYGNMAGSLSYGYDGGSNYDPDWNRHYDPLSGHRQSYHGHYTSRHPDYYNAHDRRQGDDQFRPLDRY